GPTIFLEITGKKHFKGLLLYALDSSKNHVGQWWIPPPIDVSPITFVGTIVVSAQKRFQIVETNQSFTACGSNNTIVPTQPTNSTYLSSTTPSSSNIFNTSLNDVSGLDATPIF
ncbi:15042_t:CDS:2, partial [Gigaspora rosea]